MRKEFFKYIIIMGFITIALGALIYVFENSDEAKLKRKIEEMEEIERKTLVNTYVNLTCQKMDEVGTIDYLKRVELKFRNNNLQSCKIRFELLAGDDNYENTEIEDLLTINEEGFESNKTDSYYYFTIDFEKNPNLAKNKLLTDYTYSLEESYSYYKKLYYSCESLEEKEYDLTLQ